MTTKENARAGIAVPAQAVETGAASRQTTTSTSKRTTPAAERQPFRIADLLAPGEENAIPLKHIKQLVNLPGREIRKRIQLERLQHIPILANNRSGYYLAENDQERKRFVRSMRHRAAEIAKVAQAIEEADVGD